MANVIYQKIHQNKNVDALLDYHGESSFELRRDPFSTNSRKVPTRRRNLRSLDKSGQNADNPAIRLCPRTEKALILLVELTRIERATS